MSRAEQRLVLVDDQAGGGVPGRHRHEPVDQADPTDHRGHQRREIDDLHRALGLDGEHGAVYDGDRRGLGDAHHRSSVAGPPARTRPGPAKTSSQDTRAVICISTNKVSTAPMVIARPVMPWKKNA